MMDIRKLAVYEWFDSIGKLFLGSLLVLAFLAILVMQGVVPAIKAGEAEKNLRHQLEATDAGHFALVQLRECQAGGGMLSQRSEVDCVGQIVAAAKLLKGEQFARDVSRTLAIWIDRRSLPEA